MMFCRELLVVLLVLAVTCYSMEWNGMEWKGGRIIGGTPVKDIRTYPYSAHLQRSCGDPGCAATIISPLWLMTAGMCTRGEPLDELRVVAGTLNIEVTKDMCYGPTQIRFIAALYVDLAADLVTRIRNFGLIKLTSELDFGPNVNAASLPPKGDPSKLPWEGKTCKTLGWGRTETSIVSPVVMEVDLPVISQKECRKKFSFGEEEWKSVFCTQSDGIKAACRGDTGTPLICDGVVVGISTYANTGTNCFQPGFTVGWIRVDQAVDRINDLIHPTG